MRQKKGFTLRTVCGEHVIVAEGLEVNTFFLALVLLVFCFDSFDGNLFIWLEQALADVDKMIAQWQEIGVVE